jgi:predicted Fe-Mo cluster-binding NifX family protein
MKISLISDGKDLSSPLASTFERCSYFIIVDSNREDLVISLLNYAETTPRGTEIQAAQLLVDNLVEVVITPQIGINALNVLQIAGIKVYLGNAGTLQENIDAYRQGKLIETKLGLNMLKPKLDLYPIWKDLERYSKRVLR